MRNVLEGVLAPIPTPFDADGAVFYERLVGNIVHWCSTPLSGLVVLGSNGEAVMLTEQERRTVWETARSVIPLDKHFIAGAGAESVHASLSQLHEASVAGADAALVVTPHYYKGQVKGAALVDYYRRLADASPIPLILYNMPRATGVDLAIDSVVELAGHGNIVGLKDSGGNIAKIGQLIEAVPPEFTVIAGSAGFLYPALCLGARACIAALANLAPRACHALYESFLRGRHDDARRLQLGLLAINQAVTEGYGVPGLKAALDEQGLVYGGPPRLPLQPLGPGERESLRKLLRASLKDEA